MPGINTAKYLWRGRVKSTLEVADLPRVFLVFFKCYQMVSEQNTRKLPTCSLTHNGGHNDTVSCVNELDSAGSRCHHFFDGQVTEACCPHACVANLFFFFFLIFLDTSPLQYEKTHRAWQGRETSHCHRLRLGRLGLYLRSIAARGVFLRERDVCVMLTRMPHWRLPKLSRIRC